MNIIEASEIYLDKAKEFKKSVDKQLGDYWSLCIHDIDKGIRLSVWNKKGAEDFYKNDEEVNVLKFYLKNNEVVLLEKDENEKKKTSFYSLKEVEEVKTVLLKVLNEMNINEVLKMYSDKEKEFEKSVDKQLGDYWRLCIHGIDTHKGRGIPISVWNIKASEDFCKNNKKIYSLDFYLKGNRVILSEEDEDEKKQISFYSLKEIEEVKTALLKVLNV